MCVVDEAEIERGRGRKNVNSLRKPEASGTHSFCEMAKCAHVLQFLRGSISIETIKHK